MKDLLIGLNQQLENTCNLITGCKIRFSSGGFTIKSISLRDIYEKIKKGYEKLSGASKFIIVLAVLLIVSNVVIIIWSNKTYGDLEQLIDNIIKEDTYETLRFFDNIKEIINNIFELAKYLIFILTSIFAYYISQYVGKMLGFLKLITEFLSDIKEDGCLPVVALIYDIIGLTLDLYTIYSIVTA